MTEQRQQLENQPPAGPMYQWALDWYNAQEHPLTDETMERIAINAHWSGDIGDVVFRHDDMRSATDWQLEQVIEWLKVNLMKHNYYEGYAYISDDYDSNAEIEVDKVLEDLKRAMRPKQQEDN